tara:strand:- start:687 stop:941 length:255 start_codon:yes stop_codon:yes gene_type:complete
LGIVRLAQKQREQDDAKSQLTQFVKKDRRDRKHIGILHQAADQCHFDARGKLRQPLCVAHPIDSNRSHSYRSDLSVNEERSDGT